MAKLVHVKAHTRKAPKSTASQIRDKIRKKTVDSIDIGNGINVLRPKVSLSNGNVRGFSSGEMNLIKRFNRRKTS